VSFDGITLTPITIGCVVGISRELSEDAQNVSQIIENALTKALAVKLDTVALNGGARPLGILNYGISSTSAGSIATNKWTPLQTAVLAIRQANAEPNGYIVSPATQKRFASLKTGDGSNSAAFWLVPPPDVQSVTQYVTTSMADDTVLVGDFEQVLFGMRTGVQIEVTNTGGTAFMAHRILVKCTVRFDSNIMHAGSFYALTSVAD
jgi:HK97 family phage major capsid protein